jgi:hypothetical protein
MDNMNMDVVINNLKRVQEDDNPDRQASGIAMALWEVTQWICTSQKLSDELARWLGSDVLNENAFQEFMEKHSDDDIRELRAAGYDITNWEPTDEIP